MNFNYLMIKDRKLKRLMPDEIRLGIYKTKKNNNLNNKFYLQKGFKLNSKYEFNLRK